MGNEKNTVLNNYEPTSVLRGNDKWVVTVRLKDCDDIMTEYYLYTLDFIYGDKRQQEKFGVKEIRKKQYIGSRPDCKILLPGEDVKEKQGYISFEQDYGLLYVDNMTNTARTLKDGLTVSVCDYVLTFRKEKPVYRGDSIYKGYVVVDDTEPEADLKKFAEECKQGVVKNIRKAIWKEHMARLKAWFKRNF